MNEVVLLPRVIDNDRGDLIYCEIEKQVPFQVKRFFYILDTPKGNIRGQHAHKECEQFFISVRGWFKINIGLQNGLNVHNGSGIHIPKNTWFEFIPQDENSIALVLASHSYDPEDYIYDKGLLSD